MKTVCPASLTTNRYEHDSMSAGDPPSYYSVIEGKPHEIDKQRTEFLPDSWRYYLAVCKKCGAIYSTGRTEKSSRRDAHILRSLERDRKSGEVMQAKERRKRERKP